MREEDTFTRKYFDVLSDAVTSIQKKVTKAKSISLEDIKNPIYETALSQKYKGIYNIYELMEVYGDTPGEGTTVKGIDVNKEEYLFELTDITPENICEIADRLNEGNKDTEDNIKCFRQETQEL